MFSDFLLLVGAVFVTLGAIFLLVVPDEVVEIHRSYSTGECVAMIVYNEEHPRGQWNECPAEMPETYQHVWVQ